MKLGVMQPYFFPYIGYFQLVHAVDKFVFYDDVNYIKQGWINRNRILNQGKDLLFTVPLTNPSSFSRINEIDINDKLFALWANKFLKTIEQSYKKAPYYGEVRELIGHVLSLREEYGIGGMAKKSVVTVCSYLGVNCNFVQSSVLYQNDKLTGKDRLIDICQKEDAKNYINSIGGKDLYNKVYFNQFDIKLEFLKPKPISYTQFGADFMPWLSIIDVLMFNSKEETGELISKYELV